MTKSRLNFKKRSVIADKNDDLSDLPMESDNYYTEDEDPLSCDVYSADDAEFDDILPMLTPGMFSVPNDASDPNHSTNSGNHVKAVDTFSNGGESDSSCHSTASWAPVSSFPRQVSWSRVRSKNQVSWFDNKNNNNNNVDVEKVFEFVFISKHLKFLIL